MKKRLQETAMRKAMLVHNKVKTKVNTVTPSQCWCTTRWAIRESESGHNEPTRYCMHA